jgi:hypothetical protein
MKEKFFKKIFFISFIVLTMPSLISCTNTTAIEELPERPGKQYAIEYSNANDIQNQFQGSTKTFDSKKDAYIFALNNFLVNQVVPGDTYQLGYNKAYGSIADNIFAICDLNGDGTDELLVKWLTADLKDRLTVVCRFDERTKVLNQCLIESGATDFYNDGKVIALWADPGNSYGKYFWPYSLYEYDKREGQYKKVSMVLAWSKELKPVDSYGNSYPEDIDKENAGEVYLINELSKTDITTISRKEYEKWVGEITKSGKLDVPYKNLTRENINQIGNIK